MPLVSTKKDPIVQFKPLFRTCANGRFQCRAGFTMEWCLVLSKADGYYRESRGKCAVGGFGIGVCFQVDAIPFYGVWILLIS